LLSGARTGVEIVVGGNPQNFGTTTTEGSVVDMELLVDQHSHPYLNSHKVKGVPVLPVVLVLEWFGRAAHSLRPDLSFVSCNELKVLSGIRLMNFDTTGDRFVLRAQPIETTDTSTYSLELLDLKGKKHYTAKVTLKARFPEPDTEVPKLGDLEKWSSKVYGGALFHGPDFQVIRELEGVCDDGIAGVLVGAREMGWPTAGAWQTDPALLDGGLQLAVLWTERMTGGASLPTGLGSFHVYHQGLAQGDVHCIVKARSVGRDHAISDIVFQRQDGYRLAELRGVKTFVMPSSARTKTNS
jgi:hypothetical protein